MKPKFRVWDKLDKEIYEAEEIHWFRGELDFIGDGITFKRDADEVELMQSTGLHDKNGKEIFEGDIVDYKGRKAIIKWHGSYASFIYRFVDEMQERVSEWDPLFLAYHHFEIIGNVYEDKEFLEDME